MVVGEDQPVRGQHHTRALALRAGARDADHHHAGEDLLRDRGDGSGRRARRGRIDRSGRVQGIVDRRVVVRARGEAADRTADTTRDERQHDGAGEQPRPAAAARCPGVDTAGIDAGWIRFARAMFAGGGVGRTGGVRAGLLIALTRGVARRGVRVVRRHRRGVRGLFLRSPTRTRRSRRLRTGFGTTGLRRRPCPLRRLSPPARRVSGIALRRSGLRPTRRRRRLGPSRLGSRTGRLVAPVPRILGHISRFSSSLSPSLVTATESGLRPCFQFSVTPCRIRPPQPGFRGTVRMRASLWGRPTRAHRFRIAADHSRRSAAVGGSPGRTMRTSVPPRSEVSTVIVPPCLDTTCFTMASPSPDPGIDRDAVVR